MANALLTGVAGLLGGNLHKGSVRGAYEGMRYTVDLSEGARGGANCGFCGLGSIVRTGIDAGMRLVRGLGGDILRIRLELSLPTGGEFDARPVSAAVRSWLKGAGSDPADFEVRLSSTRLTVVLRRSLATAATVGEALRTASASAGGARAASREPSNCV